MARLTLAGLKPLDSRHKLNCARPARRSPARPSDGVHYATSRPFAPPESGKIAVKVINHYGDEVLKVHQVT